MKVVIVETNHGPYHIARLNKLHKVCLTANIQLTCIELSSREIRYPWINNSDINYNQVTLFNDIPLEKIPLNNSWKILSKYLINIQPDIIFSAGYSSLLNIFTLMWSTQLKIPVILISDSIRKRSLSQFFYYFIKKILINQFSCAFVSGSLATSYLTSYGYAKDKIFTGVDTIDNDLFSYQRNKRLKNIEKIRASKSLPQKFFLCVSRFIKEKNLLNLIKAYEKYLNDNRPLNKWGLVICGSGLLEKNIKEYVQRVKSNIILPGFIQQIDLFDYYASASCFILPSTNETWGLVINEAMSSNLPILASSKVGCVPDLVISGQNGFVFDPNNISDICKKMISISELDDWDLKNMGNESFKLISNWNLDRYIRGFFDCINYIKNSDYIKKS